MVNSVRETTPALFIELLQSFQELLQLRKLIRDTGRPSAGPRGSEIAENRPNAEIVIHPWPLAK